MGRSLSEIIKNLAVGANEAGAPTSILFGIVTGIAPLEITIEQKLKLTKEFLVLTKNVKDYTVDISMEWNTESESLNADHSHTLSGDISVTSTATVNPNPDNISVSINNEINKGISTEEKDINLEHNHLICGKKQITIHNGLKLHDNVILIQQQGGNNFIVIDKF